jgi:hypothetical protein
MKTLMLLLQFVLSSCAFAIPGHCIFFLTSSEANIALLHENNYILRLTNPVQYITYLRENPKRMVGVMPLPEFISLWSDQTLKNNFSSNPPKVAIVAVSATGTQRFNAIMTNPSLVKNKLSYQISVLHDQHVKIGNLKYIAIIFDNAIVN